MRKAVIFDLDGTLTQSEEGIWASVKYAAEKLGFPEPDAPTLRKFIGPPLGYSFREYMGMDDATADKAVEAYRERYNVVGLFFGVPFSIWTVVALAALAGLIYLLVRPNPYEEGAGLRRKAAAV